MADHIKLQQRTVGKQPVGEYDKIWKKKQNEFIVGNNKKELI